MPPWKRVQRLLRDLALLLSILGGVAFVGGGLIFITIEELQSFALGVVGVGAILLALAGVSSFVQVRAVVTGRRGRYTTNAIIIVTLFTAIVVLLAFISFQNTVRWDATATRQFTLAPQTIKVLGEMSEPVKVTAFFIPTDPQQRPMRRTADDLLFEFNRRSNGKLTYQLVDPEENPSVARQLEVSQYPSLVFQAADSGKRHLVTAPPVTEQDLISALLIVTGAQQKKVYFLTGHGEKDINDVTEGSIGFGFSARGIVADNYQIGTINLFQDKEFPDDVAVLVVAGPKRDLIRSVELPLFIDWLKDGGQALFLFDPNPPATFQEVLSLWGVEFRSGTVVDTNSSVTGDPRTILIQRNQYASSEITSPLDATFYPHITAIDIPQEFKDDPRKQPPWIQYQPLLLTSSESWVTEDNERNSYDEEKDGAKGRLALGLIVRAQSTLEEEPANSGTSAGEESPTPTTMVIIGDSDFATNQYFHAYSNGDLLVNTVDWLAEEYELISIRPKLIAFRQLVLTRPEFDFVRYSSWFLFPIAIGLLALVAWWRRR